MVCSTCGHDVDEYYRGRQCKECFRIPQRAYHRRNRDKENAYAQKRRKENPEKYRRDVETWRKKNRTHYRIHQSLKDKYHARYLTDAYIRKRVRQSVGPIHIITDQDIEERREQIIKWRQKRIKKQETESKPMAYCLMVKREILADICQNVQVNYLQNCAEDCDYLEDPDRGLELRDEVKDRLKAQRE